MIEVQTQISLADYTTLNVGGPASEFVSVKSDDELLVALDYPDQILILGEGSNLLISDSGFLGRVIHIQTTGLEMANNQLVAAAGENWDQFVSWAVEQGYGEFAPLTGIPGTVGATPIQNVGAYGTDVSELIDSVVVYDRLIKEKVTFTNQDCKFSYRNSMFKQNPGRFVILQVIFKCIKTSQIEVKYDELAKSLAIPVGSSADAIWVMRAVRALRMSKGMVLDPKDRDTYSVGSFFLNPRVSADSRAELPDNTPSWLQQDGSWKISAAWLIGEAGFQPGFHIGDAAISSKHLLAICNLGNATTKDILKLANQIRTEVKSRFDIELEFEPNIV